MTRRRRSTENLRSRLLIATAAVMLIPLMVVTLVIGTWVHDAFRGQSLRVQQQAARIVESEIRSEIDLVETQLVLLDEVLALATTSPDEQQAILRNLLANNPIYQDLCLFTTDGEEVARASRSGQTVTRPLLATGTIAEVIAELTAGQDTYFGPVRFDQTLREPLQTIAVPLVDRRTGTVDAALIATLRFKQVWDLLAEIVAPGDSDVYVVNAAGFVVAHRNPAIVLGGTEFAVPTGDGENAGLRGESAIVATTPLQLGDEGLTVVAEQSTGAALRSADRAVIFVLGVMFAGLAVAIALIVLAVRYVVRPIEGLAASADAIADGDLSRRADVSTGGEVGRLATSFNTMTDRLSDEIQSLEDRVRRRTAALEEAAVVQTELIEQLERQAAIDFLTGLPNRYSLERRLDIELVRSTRLGSKVALFLLDLDDFKAVNDTFGHGLGDLLLVAVGERLQQTVRGVDAVCRLGGDEFAIVQSDVTGRPQVDHLAGRLLAVFTDAFELDGQQIYSGVSIGVAIDDGTSGSVAELMQQADVALYRAKDEGRNTYRVFASEMHDDVRRRTTLAQDLRTALERDELFLEYQPQVRLDDRCVVAVEALVRWRHPTLGVIPPSEVLPVAETAGLIEEVGEFVLRGACAQARQWRDDGLPAFPIAVNLSALQVRDAAFVPLVERILLERGLDPDRLEFEISETALVEGKRHVDSTLRELHRLGVGISLDDFGRGAASLDHLRRHPVRKIKIDTSLVRDTATDPAAVAVVGAVIDLAGELGVQTVAEGVEHDEELHRLEALGCPIGQGFLFSRPIAAAEIAPLVTIGNDVISPREASAVGDLLYVFISAR